MQSENELFPSIYLTLSVVLHVIFSCVKLQQAAHIHYRLELWAHQVHLLLLQH